MRKLRDDGRTIVFITHVLEQVDAISDRITVLRNGGLVGTFATGSLSRIDLIARMLGRNLTELDDMSRLKLAVSEHATGEVRLSASQLGRTDAIEPFDLELRAGEVVGLAGLLGSGRSEMAGLLFGIDKPDSGTLTVDGRTVERHSPIASIARGVALSPEDRKAEGIVDDLTVRENIVLALQAGRGWFRSMRLSEQYRIADQYIRLLRIATPTADQPVRTLSGGNQQKVILARWLATDPQVLILDEPTRGIDVGAKAEVQRLVLSLAEDGKACLFISSELDEVMRTSHRVVVLRDRVKVDELSGEIDESVVMHAMAGTEA
jgi:simple sugar transport system ATP-binding protein